MHVQLAGSADLLAVLPVMEWLNYAWLGVKVFLGFSLLIFVHELGHFLAAKWMGVRVDRFAVGFGYRLFGFRRGEGFTFGRQPEYSAEELRAKGYAETDYCLKALPFGGYVKMLGQDDLQINEETGELTKSNDPRAFPNKPVGQRMVVVSAGVVFNLLFAVIAYAAVYQFVGRKVPAPYLGFVPTGSPMAQAGLMAGDRVLAVNDRPTSTYVDIIEAAILGSDPLRFRVERHGKVLDYEIHAPGRKAREALGLNPPLTLELQEAWTQSAQPVLNKGDKLVTANGRPLETYADLITAFENCGGQPVEIVAERPAAPGEPPQLITLHQRPIFHIEPPEPEGGTPSSIAVGDLLGLRPRPSVEMVMPRTPAEEAGFKDGDVITRWGNLLNPLYPEIRASILDSPGRETEVLVERAGQPVTLRITPKRPFRLFGTADAQAGIRFGTEIDRPVVADVAPDSPAASLGLPRGAEILAAGETPVRNWIDLAEAFRHAVGTTVSLRYRAGSDEVAAPLSVPSTIMNELDLPPAAVVTAVDGESSVTLASGARISLPLSSLALQKLLAKHVGRPVTIEFCPSRVGGTPQTRSWTVPSGNLDPWQTRLHYLPPPLGLGPMMTVVTARGNPARALLMGVEESWKTLATTYYGLKSMLAQRVGVQDLSGPVGIFRVTFKQAEASVGSLLHILAWLSVNLAVINFLPLPVVDGGLMVFLIIEKFRGKPMSVKVQVITTLTGLALIVLCFIFVTFQDIMRWASGGL